jgi:hypothetical protein
MYLAVFNSYRALVLKVGEYNMRLIANKRAGDERFEALAAQYQRYYALLTQAHQNKKEPG